MDRAMSLVVPLALGAAISPTLLTLQLLIMSGAHKPRARAWALVLGCALALAAYMTFVATVARGINLASSDQSTTERVVKLAAAVLLIGLGIRALRHRHDPPKPPNPRIQNARTGVFVGIGFAAMAANFSSLVLILPAVHITINAGLPAAQQMVLMGFIALMALLPVLLPPLATTVLGRRADPGLNRMNHIATTYNYQIRAGIAFFFTALLIFSALR